jgi:Mlc titration factor MtfA (ptsG expression regulator)
MFSRILMLPFGLVAAFSLYTLVFNQDFFYTIILSGSILVIAGIFMVEKQINFWWSKKNPPKTDAALKNFLYNYIPFYRGLPVPMRTEFERRLDMAESRIEVYSKTEEDLSDDVKILSCIYPTILDFKHNLGLWKKFNHVVLYGHPFLSPERMEKVHISEFNKEDGVYIYSLEHLQLGFRNTNFFNIALYEAANAFLSLYPDRHKIHELCSDRDRIFNLGVWSIEELEAYCGELPDQLASILIHHFYIFPEKVKTDHQQAYEILVEIFGDYHVLTNKPIII